MQIFPITRRKTVGVKVGHVQVGGGAPVVVQSMTNTDTADIAGTVTQCKELADAGSELVRITVNMPESAAAVAEIVARLRDAGCVAPIIGDFHYNGHVLLTKYPDCARALDKYRINPEMWAREPAATSSSRRSAKSRSITASPSASA